ncbi:MAG: hypothetical protein U0736_11430 [Gemmataceae bacterium]
MKSYVSALLAGLVVALAANADTEKPSSGKLNGNWEVVSLEADGMKADGKTGGLEKAVVKNGKVTFYAGEKAIPTFSNLRIVLDPKQPTALDLVRGERESLPCLHQLSEDVWKLAVPMVPGKPKPGSRLQRPGSFETKGKPVIVIVAKRVK